MTSADQNESKTRYLLRYILLMSFFLMIGIFISVKHIQNEVQESYTQSSSAVNVPDTLLKHATTYYWFARYKNNTYPEFQKSIQLAQKAKFILENQSKNHREEYHLLNLKADQIIEESQDWLSVSKLNMVSAIPFYAGIMGLDSTYVEEDSDSQLLKLRTIQRGIDKIIDLGSPDNRVIPIKSRVTFALVNVPNEESQLQELVVQQLNAKTQLYTIAQHEIAEILGRIVSITEVISDSTSMQLLAKAFNTGEIAIINIIKKDVVDGIYSYGIRLELWSNDLNSVSYKWYTEIMLKDRTFNQLLPLLIPITFIFLSICFIIGLFIKVWFDRDIAETLHKKYPFYHVALSFAISMTGYLLGRKYLLIPFINPGPEAMHFDSMAEFWMASFPVVLILLPSTLSYIILGKFDNWFSWFESKLDTHTGLFSWLSGALLVIPFVFTYNQILRFGFDTDQWLFVLMSVLVLSQAWFISKYLISLLNSPWKISTYYKIPVALFVFTHLSLLMVSVYLFNTEYSVSMTLKQFIYVYLPVSCLTYTLWLLINQRYVNPKFEILKDLTTIYPNGFANKQYKISKDTDGYILLHNTFSTKIAFLDGKKGVKPEVIVENILFEPGQHRYYHIDFNKQKPDDDDTHYYPFAFAFREVFSKNRFNDVTEKARRAGNLVGRLISKINSIGEVFIDDNGNRARKKEDIARDIIVQLNKDASVVLFSHLESADQQSIDLLLEILHNYLRITLSKRPLILLASNTNYTHKHEIVILATKYSELSNAKWISIPISYDKPAFDILATWKLPIQAKIALAEELEKQSKDSSPDMVEDILNQMVKSGHIRTNKNISDPFMYVEIESIKDLPEFEPGIEFKDIFERQDNVSLVLLAAAYAANANGQFPITLLERMTSLSRLELLQILRQLERVSYVYDIRNEEYNEWFSFIDPRYVTEIKETENAQEHVISQLTKEFYKCYLEYFLPYNDWDQNIQSLKNLNIFLSDYDHFILAQRAMKLRAQDSMRAFKMNLFVAKRFSEPEVAQFEFALECINNVLICIESDEKLKYTSKKLSALILKLNILNEKGTSKLESNDVVKEIDRLNNQWQLLNDSEKLELNFAIIRYCFIHFDKNNQKRGNELCDKLLIELDDEISLVRVKFYKIKLIPSNNLTVNFVQFEHNKYDLNKIIELRDTYKLLIQQLSLLDTQKVQSRLLGEIINDYAGSFLTDKLLESLKSALKSNSSEATVFLNTFVSKESVFREIDQLLIKRFEIAGFISSSFSTVKKMDLQSLDAWIFSNSTIDRRGLCYTLNYLNRALFSVGEYEESIKVGKLSYKLNRTVRDYRGCSVVSGIIAEAYTMIGFASSEDYAKVFKWQERSFGYSWLIGNVYRAGDMVWKMLNTSEVDNGQNEYLLLSRAYMRQVEMYHILDHLEMASIHNEFLRVLCMDLKSIENKINSRDTRSIFSTSFASDYNSMFGWIESFYRYFRVNHDSMNIKGSIRLINSNEVADVDFEIHEYVDCDLINSRDKCELKFTLHFNDRNRHLPWYDQGVGKDNMIEITSDEMRMKCKPSYHDDDILVYETNLSSTSYNLVGIIKFKKELEAFQIVTAYPGTYAPKFPKQCHTDSERAESVRFWQNYAFITSTASLSAIR